MASYVYNPSKKVTELLSKFLEFDPESLEMGIWSGDLSLKDVELRRDAIQPLLNRNSGSSSSKKSKKKRSTRYGPEPSTLAPAAASPVAASPSSQRISRRRPQQSSAAHYDSSNQNPLEDPLRIKLVRGSIGKLRVRIPWREQLVWGQGAVQLEISDVTIVLSFQSREETAREEAEEARLARDGNQNDETEVSSDDETSDEDEHDYDEQHTYGQRPEEVDSGLPRTSSSHRKNKKRSLGQGHSRIYHRAYREAKQRRLREAERRQMALNSNPNSSTKLTSWLEQLHQTQSIAKEAYKAEQRELHGGTDLQSSGRGRRRSQGRVSAAAPPSSFPSSAQDQELPPKVGRVDRYLRSVSSDLFWRLFTGVKGSISKARIVLLQDGVEVGCIVQSLEVLAGKDGIESLEVHSHHQPPSNPSKTDPSNTSGSHASTNSKPRHPEQPKQASLPDTYDDGEHVDKLVRQTGLGIFVRRETSTRDYQKIPTELRFSSSVEADDYILRPVEKLDVRFSLFYPHPPERWTTKPKATANSIASSRKNTSIPGRSSNPATYSEPLSSAVAPLEPNPSTTASSVASSSQQSGKSRRGKRDKQPSLASATAGTPSGTPSRTITPRPPVPTIRTRLDTIQSVTNNDANGMITPASRISSSGDTFFSDPRIPLDDADAAALLRSRDGGFERRGKIKKTRSADSADNNERKGLSPATRTLFSKDDLDESFYRSKQTDRRHAIQRLRTPIRSGVGVSVTPPPMPSRPLSFASASRESSRESSGMVKAVSGNSTFQGMSSTTASVANDSAMGAISTDSLFSPTIVPDVPTTPCPSLQLKVGVDEVQVVFTTRHYELLSYLFSTIAKMKNGRPDRTIRSVKATEPGRNMKALLLETTAQQSPLHEEQVAATNAARSIPFSSSGSRDGDSAYETASSGRSEPRQSGNAPKVDSDPSGIISYLWPSSSEAEAVDAAKAAAAAALENKTQHSDRPGEFFFSPMKSGSFHSEDNTASNPLGPSRHYEGRQLKSARQEVVAQWWKYAIGAIQFEIRKRKHVTSVFRDIYISFDWKKQRHRRQEYIDLYIGYKLTRSSASSNVPIMGGWSTAGNFYAKQLRDAEDTLAEIEDELHIEQILLYRSIARAMKGRGMSSKKMPPTLYELWGRRERPRSSQSSLRPQRQSFDTAESTRSKSRSSHRLEHSDSRDSLHKKASRKFKKKMSNTSFASHDFSGDGFENEGGGAAASSSNELLGTVQTKFDATQKLRSKGGAEAHFATKDSSDETDGKAKTEKAESDDGDEDDSVNAITNNDPLADAAVAAPKRLEPSRFYTMCGSKREFATIGDAQTKIEGRTVRSNRTRKANRGSSTGEVYSRKQATPADTRMRLFFSFQIRKFNLVVVEEDYAFDGSKGRNHCMDSDLSERDEDSSSGIGDLSDLSVLTDDERFFSDDDGEARMMEEEEEEFEDSIRPKMRSTDFLSFGQPENMLLRMTIFSFATSSKGISGGGMEVGVSVARIEAVGDQDTHILSMGPPEPNLPVEEIDTDRTNHKTELDGTDVGSVDLSMYISGKHQRTGEGMMFTMSPSKAPRQAISLKVSKEGLSTIVQCDLSKIAISSNIEAAEKLFRFYSRPDAKQPETLLTESSRDVARKIMVKKISNTPTKSFSNITSAIRIHGIEVRIPFSVEKDIDSEHSTLDSSYLFSPDPDGILPEEQPHKYSTVFVAGILELYSGNAVDELVQSATIMSEFKDRSVAGASLTSFRSQTAVRTLEMLDIAELTSAHDSFSADHFVLTVRGITCGFESDSACVPNLMGAPVNIEVLATTHQMPLLDSDSAKEQVVVEISPVNILLSEHRLELLTATKSALDLGKLTTNTVTRKRVHPDPPRIDILSKRILNSLDLTCTQVRVELLRDEEIGELGPPKIKELVMEETLSDFLSVVACFDFNLPNEEALSSAMQVSIGRLMGLGMSDEEAWACTNRARVNFLDDISLMRKTESKILEMTQRKSMKQNEEKTSCSTSIESSMATDDDGFDCNSDNDNEDDCDDGELSDDDSKNSAHMVETTINSAVEKTVVSYSTLLQSFIEDGDTMNDSVFLFLDLPMGFSLSMMNMFYDQHVRSFLPSVVVTNKAGIEILTIVPDIKNDSLSGVEKIQGDLSNNAVVFSRFNLDTEHEFGKGGLPISVLASDQGAESDLVFRKRSRFDDIEVGECEFFFSSSLFEEIIDGIRNILPKSTDGVDSIGGDDDARESHDNSLRAGPLTVTTSTLLMASSVSLLFTSETLVPFCRISLENACVKNGKAMESLDISDTPTFALVAKFFAIQNLCPEGQFFPDVLQSIPPTSSFMFPLQVRFFQSTNSWEYGNRLEVDFTAFRFFLVRQFINDLLQYFAYDNYGVGKLRKKYETTVVDSNGNAKPPLLYSISIFDTSIICPRNSTSNDMVAFEVEDASIAVSYVPKSFAMPTESSPFCANPTVEKRDGNIDTNDSMSIDNSFASVSDYEDCASFGSNETLRPISSHTSDLKRRLSISLNQFRVFTALAGDKTTEDVINSSQFRFIHSIDGRAEHSKPVYTKDPGLEKSISAENLLEFEKCSPSWEEISTNPFCLEILFDSAPHTRLLVSSNDASAPLSLDARLSQLCLLLSIWDSNMQELGTMCPVSAAEVFESASPPSIPDSFPEYASEEFVSFLESIDSIGSEICCMIKMLSIRCTFDEPGYFSKDPDCFQYFEDPDIEDKDKPGLILTLEGMVVHVVNNDINVKRIGVGSSAINIIDERRVPSFQSVLSSDSVIRYEDSGQHISWADLSWGLREDVKTLSERLPQPVQCSIFMTPGWSMTNLGIQNPNGSMHDLSWLWVLLGFFKSYYSDGAFGNPGFEAQQWSHRIKNALRRSMDQDTLQFVPQPGLNIDFRVWLLRPTLCLPSDYFDSRSPSLVLSSTTGLWYRYKSIQNYSSQEVVSTDLNLSFANEFIHPERFLREAHSRASRSTGAIRPMIEGLSFGLRYDSNNSQCNHKDISFTVPFAGENSSPLSIVGQELEVEPIILEPPKVLQPSRRLTRRLGSTVCEITCIIEAIPLASATLMNFFCGPLTVNEKFAPIYDDQPPQTLSVTAKIRDMRMFLIDPDLGVQLPIAVLSLSSSTLSLSKFSVEPIIEGLAHGESQPSDMQLILASDLWIDYFKLGLTRSWEPLLEPFQSKILYETSSERGQGYSFTSDCPLHFNLSGGLLSFLSEASESLSTAIRETFGERSDRARALEKINLLGDSMGVEGGARLEDIVKVSDSSEMSIVHEVPKLLKGEEKVAFSLRNLTGQRIRIHQQSNFHNKDKPVVVTYLNQGESAGLTFAATISVVKNLRIVEVPYPGFEVSKSNDDQKQGSLNHAIDLQVPGCQWIQGVRLDTFGRKFQSLTPRSLHVFNKISNDWRLRNAMTVLTEVGPDNGGRLLSVRSIFQIKNRTTHSVKLNFHPDPKHKPDIIGTQDTTEKLENVSEHFDIGPGCDFQLPTLLVESSLEMKGSHLGSVWVRPDTSRTESFSFRDFSKPTATIIEEFDTSYCSRPVQLAKIVHETSVIFNNGGGEDVGQSDATSGVQVSCPTHSRSGNIRTPFCYAIEICRSPIVKANVDQNKPFLKNKKKEKSKRSSLVHAPVAYSLVIHSPLVIVNLLPEGGRFELMHAIRKTVVWYADLEPGQQVPVHSLGLDSPLLLLVNLGFCRTPVGEGALVHHGGESVEHSKEQNAGLKSFGKAISKGTKKIGKRLTNLAESPDKRAQERVAKMFSPQSIEKRRRKGNGKQKRLPIAGRSLGLDLGETGTDGIHGKIHAIKADSYSAEDIANETTVVDGVGQRLRLRIENVRGGGGQRRISLYCPYWIVNTTEHALRYKQEKDSRYVSGTVISPEKNGSLPVDGSNRNYRSRYEMQSKRSAIRSNQSLGRNTNLFDSSVPINQETVFAGTNGALATFPGQCTLSPEDISSLIDEDMPLQKLAKIAFMYNFFEESIGVEKLIVQLYDGLHSNANAGYVSGWSAGFALETVGFSQVIGLPCKDGRVLELSATVNVAPGFLSGYTKIVRFCPRYAIYNRLERPIRLWQDSSIIRSLAEDRSDATNQLEDQSDSRKWRYDFEDEQYACKIGQYESLFGRHATINDKLSVMSAEPQIALPEGTAAHRSALYISSVGSSQLVPFFLPDTRSESQLRIDVGGPWNLTSSFASNVPGEHVLDISRAKDTRLLSHVCIRDAPKYKLILPPPKEAGGSNWDGELGAYFETEWDNQGDRKILVKGTKRGKYAFNHTDMRVGDELLRINGISVLKMTFEEAMKMIKDKLSEIRDYHDKLKLRESGGTMKNKKGVLRRLSMGGRYISSTNYDGGNGASRVLRRLSLGVKKRDTSQIEEELVEPAPLTMSFRTQEERLRKMRIKAIRARNSAFSYGANTIGNFDLESPGIESIDALTVETKAIHNTMFIILRNAEKENPPFKLQNRSLKYCLFYRQRNCEEHEWNILMPGESRSYAWEEPMKSKKLTIRIATNPHESLKDDYSKEKSSDSMSTTAEQKSGNEIEPEEYASAVRADRLRQILAYQYVNNEERGGFSIPTTVRLEEIGFNILVPVPSFAEGQDNETKYLNCEVDTDGGTRLLVLSDLYGGHDERAIMHRNIESLQKQIENEENRKIGLKSMQYALSTPIPKAEGEKLEYSVEDKTAEIEREKMIENELREVAEDFPEGNAVTKRCQVVVQVLEAVGLISSDFVGTCNPYCEIFYKGRSRSRKHFLQKRRNKRKTYFIEKTSNPKWNDQYFVFDVPEEAIGVTRGHSIQIVVRDFRIMGQHPILGQASMHCASIRNQQELVGWWPLVGRYSGNTEVDTGRGSIKLRVQWIYTLSAMIDYYSLLSQRRLQVLIKTEKGMQEQLKSANDSFERKRESMNKLPGRHIANLVKQKKKNFLQKENSTKREQPNREKNSKAKLNGPLNTNFLHLKETLKSSRTQSLKALTIKTVESRRKRRVESDEIDYDDIKLNESNRILKMGQHSKSRSDSSQSAEHTPPTPRNKRTKSLGDFFAQQRSSVRTRRGTKEWNVSQHISHRKLSLDLDESSILESVIMDASNQRQSMGRWHDLESDPGTSDLLSMNTDTQEQARRNNDIARLNILGFVFHKSGDFFHEDHLPNHFRRLLFAGSTEQRQSQLLYRRRQFVGTSSVIRHFKNWQAAQALLWDPEVEVIRVESGFHVGLIHEGNGRNQSEETKNMSNSNKSVISKNLCVPNEAPRVTIERSKDRIETMHLSRNLFDRSCRRILGCVLNPGGWLTVRPIAAMNLPDSYTGMYVKVTHGTEVQISETVDAKVSPKWSSTRLAHKGRRKTSLTQLPDTTAAADFEFCENDLHLQVEPQQTGGSIRLSVVAERYKTKVELGVVHIPLGAAIAACIDAAQSIEITGCGKENEIPLYTRWFPLQEPQLIVPVAGDMGLCTRSREQEQPRDNMFQQYFAPCIQLSLMWWPYDQNQIENQNPGDVKNGTPTVSDANSSIISRITRIPTIKTYFNADINVFSVALIDSVRAVELLNLSLREIDMKYAVTRAKTRICLVVGWIQLDQQDDNSREPVVFAPTPSEYPQPTLQFLALRDNLRTKSNIMSYEYVGLALQEMDLTVEEPRVYELWDFFMAVLSRKRMKKRALRGRRHKDVISQKRNIFDSVEQDDSKLSLFEIIRSVGDRGALSHKQKIYVEQLILGLVKINLSYVKGKKQNFELSENSMYDMHDFTMANGGGQDSRNDLKKNDQSEIFMKWSQLTSDQDTALGTAGLHNLPGIIAAVFPSVSDAPIRLQGKLVQHVFESPVEIVSSLKNYYTNETLKQVYKIIGSLDFVGNPTILLSSFMSGVKDLVSAPTAAFMKSPSDVKQVGIGVGKGTVSFLSHSASGFFGFTARLFSQAGQIAALVSFDSDYRQWHRDRVVNEATNLERVWKRRGMPKVEEIMLRPIADVVLGFTLGVSGVVVAPYRGAQKAGAKGFFTGAGLGIAGLVSKPIVGVFDALMHGSQSVHDIAKTINFLERRYQPILKLRLPYVFGPMKILAPFDPNSARSVYLLRLFPPKTKLKYRKDKGQEFHIHSEVLEMEPGVETFTIITTIRIVLIKVKRESTKATTTLSPYFGWEVDLSSGATISSQIADHGHNGVALTITKCDDGPRTKGGRRDSKTQTERTRNLLPTLGEGDEENEITREMGEDFQEAELDSMPRNSSTLVKPLSESVTSGIKQQGNKYLEWYAVLAEHQQRKQLNRIHNAISCMVGAYDEIIPDRPIVSQKYVGNDAGNTSFGIYNFEKGLPDGRAAQLSNMKLIASLEDLYWIEDDLVQRISNIESPSRRQRALDKVRQTWNFSSAMIVSKNIGGPQWLVRARAKAMSVPSDAKNVAEHIDGAPLSNRTLNEVFKGYSFDHDMTSSTSGKMSSETLDKKLQGSTQSSVDQLSGQGSSIEVKRKQDSIDSSNVIENEETEEHFPGDSGALTYSNNSLGHSSSKEQLVEGSIRRNESENVFCSPDALGLPMSSVDQSNEQSNEQSTRDDGTNINRMDEVEFYSPINGVIKDDGHVDLFRSCNSLNIHPPPPVASLNIPQDNVSSILSSHEAERHVSNLGTASETKNNISATDSNDTTRIDRLEGILEQLVILNAAQVRREEMAAAESMYSRHHHTNVSEAESVTDHLRQELGEIREKMDERAREDDSLRKEISMLRSQLADRRAPERRSWASTIGLHEIANRNARSNFDRQRPPPINTSLFPNKKKKKLIRGILSGHNKAKTQEQEQTEEHPRMLEESFDDTPEPPLGLDDDDGNSAVYF